MGSRLSLALAVEIILRILAVLLGSVPAFISAAVALSTLKNKPLRQFNYRYGYYDINKTYNIDDISEDDDFGAVQLRDNIYRAIGVTIGVACLGIILQVLFIILRLMFLYIAGQYNLIIKIVFLIDIVMSFVLAAGHNVSRELLIPNTDVSAWSIRASYYYVDVDVPNKIRNAMTFSAAYCLNATILFIILAVFMIFFLFKNWNKMVYSPAAVDKAVADNIAHSGQL